MTLIMCVICEGSCTLLTDHLMTVDEDVFGDVEEAPRLNLPFQVSERPNTQDFKQAGLRQKHFFFSASEILLCAGNLIEWRALVLALQEFSPQERLENFSQIACDTFGHSTESAFILVQLAAGEVRSSQFNARKEHVDGCTVFCAGTGSRFVTQPHLLTSEWLYSNRKADAAIGEMLTIKTLVSLIRSEMDSSNFASFRTGGAYTIITAVAGPRGEGVFKPLNVAINLLNLDHDFKPYFMGSSRTYQVGSNALSLGISQSGNLLNTWHIPPITSPVKNERCEIRVNDIDLSIDYFHHDGKSHWHIARGCTLLQGSESNGLNTISLSNYGKESVQDAVKGFSSAVRKD